MKSEKEIKNAITSLEAKREAYLIKSEKCKLSTPVAYRIFYNKSKNLDYQICGLKWVLNV